MAPQVVSGETWADRLSAPQPESQQLGGGFYRLGSHSRSATSCSMGGTIAHAVTCSSFSKNE